MAIINQDWISTGINACTTIKAYVTKKVDYSTIAGHFVGIKSINPYFCRKKRTNFTAVKFTAVKFTEVKKTDELNQLDNTGRYEILQSRKGTGHFGKSAANRFCRSFTNDRTDRQKTHRQDKSGRQELRGDTDRLFVRQPEQ